MGRSPLSRGTYALLAPDFGLVKIGSSEFIDERIRTIAMNSPARLVLIGRCVRNVEHSIHEAAWASRSHGEWFAATDDVLAIIAKHMPRIDEAVDIGDRVKSRGKARAA